MHCIQIPGRNEKCAESLTSNRIKGAKREHVCAGVKQNRMNQFEWIERNENDMINKLRNYCQLNRPRFDWNANGNKRTPEQRDQIEHTRTSNGKNPRPTKEGGRKKQTNERNSHFAVWFRGRRNACFVVRFYFFVLFTCLTRISSFHQPDLFIDLISANSSLFFFSSPCVAVASPVESNDTCPNYMYCDLRGVNCVAWAPILEHIDWFAFTAKTHCGDWRE